MRGKAVLWALAVTLGATLAAAQQPAPRPAADINQILAQVERTSQAAQLDLAQLRIEKWKGDGREQGRDYANSIQQNLIAALPGMVAAVRGAPNDLAANFKLYRNLNVLYDVFASLTELAGAFGPKDEYRALAADLQNLDAARRAMADRMDQLVTSAQAELTRLRGQGRGQVRAPAPKRIVVDDNEPPKKKKKAAPKPESSGQQ